VGAFKTLTARAAPMARANVDTEVIIPISRLIAFPRGQLGPYAFEPWRYRADGSADPDFVLNQPRYLGAQFLVADENFGCGSSREHAVWALWDMGFRVIIAPSFGDIFRANSFQNGMLTITLPQHVVEQMLAEIETAAEPVFSVDLEHCTLTTPSLRTVTFEIAPERRTALLEGLDEVGLTLKLEADITAFQERDRKTRPWAYQKIEENKNDPSKD
jgi:3-isopropylmalate/(R)-2-methylmalate dehydratase small subunit